MCDGVTADIGLVDGLGCDGDLASSSGLTCADNLTSVNSSLSVDDFC